MACFNGNEPIPVHEKNLILHIDISDKRSWSEDPADLSVKSLVHYDGTEIKEDIINNYGNFAKDFGHADAFEDPLTISYEDDKVKLLPIGAYEFENAPVLDYVISPVMNPVQSTVGHFFDLYGGYLSNYFKMSTPFNYSVMPSRYATGITLETVINVDLNRMGDGFNDGMLLYLGTRSEEKKPLAEINTSQVIDNNFGVRILKDGSVSVRRLMKGDTVDDKIFSGKVANGWNVVALVFRPYSKINDPDLLDCTKRRLGTLELYINGLWSGEFKDFDEFYFTEAVDQPGVGYTLNWGGGTFSYRHAWWAGVYLPYHGVVEKVFGGSFKGGIQKLRVYDAPLSINEIRQNFNSEADTHGLDRI